MSNIKLFSGMDFSGKTTAIENIVKHFPNLFLVRAKFLSRYDLMGENLKFVYENIISGIQISRNLWRDVIIKAFEEDVLFEDTNQLLLQDTLMIFKRIATKIYDKNNEYYKDILDMCSILKRYPNMDSFYFFATNEVRYERFLKRKSLNQKITKADSLLISEPEKFYEIDKLYRNIVLERYPNTKFINTTNLTEMQIVQYLVKCIFD